jgi:hypothetical protein
MSDVEGLGIRFLASQPLPEQEIKKGAGAARILELLA